MLKNKRGLSILSLLLTAAMLLTLLPVTALAEDRAEEEAATYEETQDSVDPDETAEEEVPEAPVAEAYENRSEELCSDEDIAAEAVADDGEETASLQESTEPAEPAIYADGYSDTYSVTLLTGTSVAIPISYDKGDSGVGTIKVKYHTDNTTTYQLSWGEWANHVCNLNVTGLQAGTGTIIVYLLDSSDDTELASLVISVEVVTSLSGSCGTNVYWALDRTGTLTISGTGEMIPEYEYIDDDWYIPMDMPWYPSRLSIQSVVISDGVTGICEEAFESLENLTNVKFGTGVTSIGHCAFYDCYNLKGVSFGSHVREIGSQAFSYCNSLTDLVIPDNVATIGDNAFENCESLTSVKIGNGLTEIESGIFSYCYNLENVTIGNSVTSIGEVAFYDCESLQAVALPKSLTTISGEAFAFCSSLTSIAIPDSVTYIESDGFGGAFAECTSLTAVSIGSGLSSIDSYAFSGCSSLKNIQVSTGNRNFTSVDGVVYSKDRSELVLCPPARSGSFTIANNVTTIDEDAFSTCTALTDINVSSDNMFYSSVNGVLYDKDKWELIFCPRGKSGSYTIPNSVVIIGEYAFADCGELTSISIPNSVRGIWSGAFQSCSGLTRITLPSDVELDGSFTFAWCENLQSITIPEGVTVCDTSWTFYECSSLTAVTLPSTIQYIAEAMFQDCSSLTSITIPEGVQSIGFQAFAGCESLRSIRLPSALTSIGDSAFWGCESLSSIRLPSALTSIGDNAFCGCTSLTDINVSTGNAVYSSQDGVLFNKTQTVLFVCPAGKSGRYDIPASVTEIAEGAFASCSRLTSIRFSTTANHVSTVGAFAFDDCTALQSISIPNTVTSIGDYAFGFENMWKETIKDDFTAYVFSGSAAEQYCKENGVHYVLRDQAVSNLASSASTDGQVTLSWTGVSGASGYVVYRGTSADGKDLCEMDTTASTSYTDQTITAVGTYYYIVEPYWMAGDERLVGIANSMQKANIDTVPSDRSPFTDVQDATEYYYQPVLWAVESSITSGTSATTFSPGDSCTRGQIVTFLWRAAGSPTVSTSNPFTDVKSSDYYYQAVLWAVKNGITSGTSNTTFSPEETCTRGQVVTFMYRAAGSPSVSTSNPFTDVKSSDYYYKAVLWAVKNGITSGTSNTTFEPGSACTRGQVVTFLYRNR